MPRKSSQKSKSPKPNKQTLVGIDLGTTNSVIAQIETDGAIKVIPNNLGDSVTPSALFFEKDRILVGKAALRASYKDPDRFFKHVKPLMGSCDEQGNPLPIGMDEATGEPITPVTFSTNVLLSLKGDCETILGKTVAGCVITVPAYFDDNQREATSLAAKLAGLPVLKILEKPVAAAVAYGMQKKEDMPLMIYDLGGGTIDCTLVRIEGGNVRVLEKEGDAKLGANDFIMRIVEHVLRSFQSKHGFELDAAEDAEDVLELMERCEAGMKDLSANDATLITCSGRG